MVIYGKASALHLAARHPGDNPVTAIQVTVQRGRRRVPRPGLPLASA